MDERNRIGSRLKEARVEKGLTLDALQQMTNIQKKYLIAIEENNFSALPNDYFFKSFIRQYAQAVGLNEESLLADAPTGIFHEEPSLAEEESSQLPSRAERKKKPRKKTFPYHDAGQNNLPTFFLVVFFIFLLGVIWWYFYFGRAPDLPNETPGSQVLAPSSQTSSSANSEEDNRPAASLSMEKQEDNEIYFTLHHFELPNVLVLESDQTGRSWIKVSVNDEDVFEGTLEAGVREEVALPEGTEEVFVRIGYLPSTSVYFGEDIEVPKPANSQVVQTQNFYFKVNE